MQKYDREHMYKLSFKFTRIRVKGLKKFLATLKHKEDGSGNNYS